MFKEKIDSRTAVADYVLQKALVAVQREKVHPNDRGAVIAGYMQTVAGLMAFGEIDAEDFDRQIAALCRGAPR